MATMINPVYSSFVPGMNPTGANIPMPSSGMSTTSGANTLLPSTSANATPGSTAANPYGGSTSSGIVPGTPSFGANTGGGYTSSGGALLPTTGTNASGQSPSDPFGFGTMTPTDQGRLFTGLKNAYGDGMAHLLMDFLSGGAGYNQQAISNLLASLQPGNERAQNALMEQFSQSGNRFGSGAQIGLADLLSQQNLNAGQLISQLYENSLNKYMDVLLGTSQQTAHEKQNSPSIWDSIQAGLGLGGQVAGILSGLSFL